MRLLLELLARNRPSNMLIASSLAKTLRFNKELLQRG